MSSTTTDSSYPAIDSAHNCIVVNDDEENGNQDPISNLKSISSSSSQNPSHQSSSATNWASLTRICHKTNNFKNDQKILDHSQLKITDKHSLHHMFESSLSSSLPTKSYFSAQQLDRNTENISNSINKISLPVHAVKSQLPNLLNDQLLSSSVSSALSAPIKLGEKLFYLNNSYV